MSRVWPFRVYDEEIGVLVTLIALHFSGENAISHFFCLPSYLCHCVIALFSERVNIPCGL